MARGKSWRKGDDLIVAAIDPGITGSGLAIFDHSNYDEPTLVDVAVLTPGTLARKEEWEFRAQIVAEQVVGAVVRSGAGRCLIEQPAFFQSHGGATAAKSGSLVKLAFFVGYLYRGLRRRQPELVSVNAWKGSLPKPVIEKRVRRRIGNATVKRLNVRSHAWDAVGIGLHHFGMM